MGCYSWGAKNTIQTRSPHPTRVSEAEVESAQKNPEVTIEINIGMVPQKVTTKVTIEPSHTKNFDQRSRL